MHYLTPLAALTSLLSLTSAAPAASPDELTARASCQPILPSTIIHLIQNSPDRSFTDNLFIQSGDASYPHNNIYDNTTTAMKFKIPKGTTGCRLHVKNPQLNPPGKLNTGGQIDTKVWTVDDVKLSQTWNNPPRKLQNVAQWNWLGGGETNLWSGPCKDELSFLFEYNRDWQTDGGWLVFDQRVPGGASLDGFSIVYDNCNQ